MPARIFLPPFFCPPPGPTAALLRYLGHSEVFQAGARLRTATLALSAVTHFFRNCGRSVLRLMIDFCEWLRGIRRAYSRFIQSVIVGVSVMGP
jgi:hypothetical protein